MATSDVYAVVNGKKTNQKICDDMVADPNEEESTDKEARLKRIQDDLGITAAEAEKYFG